MTSTPVMVFSEILPMCGLLRVELDSLLAFRCSRVLCDSLGAWV